MMLKTVILATSMLVAAPAFAQDKPATAESQPAKVAPAATAATPATDDAAPDAAKAPVAVTATPQTSPAPVAQTAQPTLAADATTQAAPAAQPAATQDQVSQAVGRDFASYDKDADDRLDAAEFGTWMSTLRKASEPSFVPGSPEAKSWEAQAFTSADIDKSANVNRQELTVFLTPKPS